MTNFTPTNIQPSNHTHNSHQQLHDGIARGRHDSQHHVANGKIAKVYRISKLVGGADREENDQIDSNQNSPQQRLFHINAKTGDAVSQATKHAVQQ